MTILSSFTPEDAELIISLPYRIGLHVSYSEDESGEQDDKLETQALEKTLLSVMQKKEENGLLAHEVVESLLASKDKWESWSQGVFNIEPLCEKAIVTLKTQVDSEEIKDYIRVCLSVASEVAHAYGEFGEGDDMDAGDGIIVKIIAEISRMIPGTKGQEAHHPMNVSATEDSAIARISDVMKKALDS
ncbi:MAG: hypothetical protein KAJ40_02650 [Alphaproteobacteria bacterium]|nr:hypothetical protein [Alphaproteobacteria bacterium]